MSVERYGETGEIICAVDGGPLKNLWKYMSLINNENEMEELKEETVKFDYNEFFKRLYLSRAELDVTNSVLQLLLKDGVGDDSKNISIDAIHYETDFRENINPLTSFGVKMEILKEISKDLRKTSDSLFNNRRKENEIVSNILLELREVFRWNLTRISNLEQQVQVTLETSTPIIGIDYSPQVLFKTCLKGEQYNYNLQIGNENLALVLCEGKSEDLSLLFQSNHLEKSTFFSFKNIKTGRKSSRILYKKLESKILSSSEISKWDEVLREARNQSIALNILKLLSQEAEKYPQDQVLIEEMNLKIVIENTFELSIGSSFGGFDGCDGCEVDSHQTEADNHKTVINCETEAENIYLKLLLNYFSSSGRELNWERIRKDLI